MTKDEKAASELNIAATVEHAKEKVQEQIHHGAHMASGPVGEAADSLRGVADNLRRREIDDAAKIVDQAAERLMSIGEYLSSLGLDKTSQPPAKARIPWWPFALVGAVIGVVLALRWLKPSGEAD